MTKILFMGTPDFSATVLKGLISDERYEILAVVTQPDRAVGRKKEIRMTPVKEAALEAGLPIYQPEKLSGSQELEDLLALGADGIVTAAFGQFLNQLRREKGWTQKDLAERLYVSDKAVSKWERGLSLPDVALLLPLAGALGVSVTELLEGRRAVQEQRYSAAEVEALIRRALAFPVEPPERQQARVKRYLPVYLICCVLGVAEALAVWLLGLAPTEMGQTCLVLGVGFGVIYGAYAFFWMAETLPRYYDENRIAQFAQGAMHIHIPGVYYNNRNWPYVLRAFRV